MDVQLDKLLQQCTLRLKVAGDRGTGFFVAPGWILTCAHTVKKAGNLPVDLYWQDRNYKAIIEKCQAETYLDWAVLRLEDPVPDHPCVHLDPSDPILGDRFYVYGYPKDYPDGDSATVEYEGEGFKANSPLYKLKEGQLKAGFSGSALLNQRTGKVCGIVNLSRHPDLDLGGRAVPLKVIFAQYPELAELNRKFHQRNQQRHGINPFDYGTPVPPERFYGRSRAIADVKNRIGAIGPQCINIVGMRRNGKTSLLRYIQERTEVFCQPDQQPLIVKLDLQKAHFHTPEGIIEGLRRGITKVTKTEPWARDANDDPFEVEDGLQLLSDRGHRLIVMLDEFELIEKRLERFQDWGEDWRAKASAGLLTMVIASLRPLDEIYQTVGVGSPFGNIFSQTIIGALEEDAWRSLVRDGFEQDSESPALTETSLQWIDELAGGLPYYVKMAAAMLWQYGDCERARSEFIWQATPRFRELWDDLNGREREVLKAAADGMSLQSHPVADRLRRHGLLRDDDRLFSSAFAEFLRGETVGDRLW